ncbi:hypothetical protein CP157_01102 [Paracoccus marcusii]|uniref:recombination protein NinB n=1 Tax=Paracoccus marcusii TaxID=59779 RepID=UPI001C3E4B32|nr:recombination protein NinB [Paracoccus marcusii]QXI63384.1 hypothetical protein CP157_01102 [Paracoccus marcusii]
MSQTVILRGLEQRALVCGMVKAAPVDAVVTIKPAARSMDQNAKLWAMLSDIARSKPEGRVMTAEMWKAAMMNALGHEILWQPGIDNGPPFPAGFRSSRLSKEQMGNLITFISEYGDRHGVKWSDGQ